jgi:hypothetical protein
MENLILIWNMQLHLVRTIYLLVSARLKVIVYPQKVTLYQTGDTVEGASFNNFLDAIDASYCTSGGGDDPNK